MLARGDLNWTAASLPPLPGAATQPALHMAKSSKEYLSNAAEAYQAITSGYSDVTHADMAARFGLAAIHEQRGEWEQAKSIYQKIAADAAKFPSYKQLADARLTAVDTLRQPVIMGKPATEPAMPELAKFPSTTFIPPTIAAPSTAPATQASAGDAKPQSTTATAPPTTRP
jgi:hypothetical protein